ncbi:hypothetical protein KCU86_g48, partial [Aureobasidium melanogenum]
MGSSTAVCQPHLSAGHCNSPKRAIDQFWICDMPEGFQPEYNNDSDSYLVFKASILIPLMLGKISVRNHVQIQMHAAFAIAKSRRYCKPLYHVRVRQMVDKYPCHGASQFCRSCFKQPQFLDLIDSDLPKFNLYSNYRRRDRSGKGH